MKNGYLWTFAAILALTMLSAWLTATVWIECRAEGHSFWYCLRLVSK